MKYIDGTGFNAQTLPRDPVEASDEQFALAQEQVDQMIQEDIQEILDEEEKEAA